MQTLDTQLQTAILHSEDGSLIGSSSIIFSPSSTITIENISLQKDDGGGFGDSLHVVNGDPNAPFYSTSSQVLGELTNNNFQQWKNLNYKTSSTIYAVPANFLSGEGFYIQIQYYPYDTSIQNPYPVPTLLEGYLLTALICAIFIASAYFTQKLMRK